MSELLRKAQLWYMDLIVGILIFTIVVVIAFQFIITGYFVPKTRTNTALVESEIAVQKLMTPGLPENWTEDYAVSIGIVDKDNSVNLTKLQMLYSLLNTDYDAARRGLGVVHSDLMLYFMDRNDSLLNLSESYYVGKPGVTLQEVEDGENDEIATLSRYVVYRHEGVAEIISLNLVVWAERS